MTFGIVEYWVSWGLPEFFPVSSDECAVSFVRIDYYMPFVHVFVYWIDALLSPFHAHVAIFCRSDYACVVRVARRCEYFVIIKTKCNT